jgi:phage-related tail fiber protein
VPLPAYYAIWTTVGLTRLAAATASGIPVPFAYVAVGDGNGAPITPSAAMTALVNERARVDRNNVDISPDDPHTVRVEGLIPSATGGFTIREAGVFNHAGELLAIASYPPIYKPTPADGVTVEEYIRLSLQYSDVTAVALTTDPDVITATRLYVDDATAGQLAIWERFT